MPSRIKHPRAAGVSCWMVATLLATMGGIAVTAAPAVAGIHDTDAAPSHTVAVHGDGSGSDAAGDVVIGSGVTWVAGSGVYAGGGYDAMLTRIQHSNWSASTRHWDSPSHRNESTSEVALAPDGSVYTAGYAGSNGTMSEMLLIKWSKTGALQWARRYNGPADGFDQALDVAVDRNGNAIVCGFLQGGSRDWVVASWTKSGKRRWLWRYDGSGRAADEARELVVDKDGRAYVCGMVTLAGGVEAAAVAKLSPTGAKLWMKTYAGPINGGAQANAIVADPRGGVLVAGFAQAGATGLDGMILRYSPNGARTSFPLVPSTGSEPDVLNDVVVTTTRTVVGVGYRGAPSTDALTVRYTLGGAVVSAAVIAAPGTIDRWLSTAADPYGGYVTGGLLGSTVTEACTRRESTLPGGAFWEQRWDGPVPGNAVIGAVAARGNLAAAVGTQDSGALTGYDSIVLFWVY